MAPDLTADLLRIATAGSVDDGKSTLIGRLLYDSKSLMSDQVADAEIDLGTRHLVGHQRLGVVEQPPDQGALAVVDRAGGGEAEELSGA